MDLIPPCYLCRHADHVGDIPLTVCRKTGETICDRGWINPLHCWQWCECSPLASDHCPYFVPKDQKEYREQLELAKQLLEQEKIKQLISDHDAYTIECIATTPEEIKKCLGGEQ